MVTIVSLWLNGYWMIKVAQSMSRRRTYWCIGASMRRLVWLDIKTLEKLNISQAIIHKDVATRLSRIIVMKVQRQMNRRLDTTILKLWPKLGVYYKQL